MMELSTPRLQRMLAETDLLRSGAEESHGLDGTL